MKLDDLIDDYINKGYNQITARFKVSQDIILYKLSKSKFSRHITIKGGVVLHAISNDIRRSTRDIDLDFIKYSLDDESIKEFMNSLNNINDDFIIEISKDIIELHHQDYNGKRVFIKIKDDFGGEITSKMDIGVHKLFEIEQDNYSFDINNRQVNLLINSNEQIFVEKLKSLLIIGRRSTRYKDPYDLYYLIKETRLNKTKLKKNIRIMILNNENIKENTIEDIVTRLKYVLDSKSFKDRAKESNSNWLNKPYKTVMNEIIEYIKTL